MYPFFTPLLATSHSPVGVGNIA